MSLCWTGRSWIFQWDFTVGFQLTHPCSAGTNGDDETFATPSTALHSAITSSTSFCSPCITVQDPCGSDGASPKVLKALPGMEIETGRYQGAVHPVRDNTHYSLRPYVHDVRDEDAREEEFPRNGLSPSDMPGCKRNVTSFSQSNECQPCTEGEQSAVSSTENELSVRDIVGVAHSKRSFSACWTAPAQQPAGKCDSVAETQASHDMVQTSELRTCAVEESMQLASGPKEAPCGVSPAPTMVAQQGICNAETSTARDTLAEGAPEVVAMAQQGLYQASAALLEDGRAERSEDGLAERSEVATGEQPRNADKNAPSTLEMPAVKSAGGLGAGGVPASRSALQCSTDAAAMIGPFGCSMGFVQLAVPWAPQRSALRGIPLALAAPAAVASPHQPQLSGNSDGQRHQQLLHQLLLQENSRQLDKQEKFHPQHHGKLSEPEASVPLNALQDCPPPSVQHLQEATQAQSQMKARKGKCTQHVAKNQDARDNVEERLMQDASAACHFASDAAPLPSLNPAVCTAPTGDAAASVAHSCVHSSSSKPHDISMVAVSTLPNSSSVSSSTGSSTQGGGKGVITMFQWPESSPDDALGASMSFGSEPTGRHKSMGSMGAPPGAPARRTRMRASPISATKVISVRRSQDKAACAAQQPTVPSANADCEPPQQPACTWTRKFASMECMLKAMQPQIIEDFDRVEIPDGIQGATEKEKAMGEGVQNLRSACSPVVTGVQQGPQQHVTGRKAVRVRRRPEKSGSPEIAAQRLADLTTVVDQANAVVAQEDAHLR